LIEDSEERLTDQQVEQLLDIIRSELLQVSHLFFVPLIISYRSHRLHIFYCSSASEHLKTGQVVWFSNDWMVYLLSLVSKDHAGSSQYNLNNLKCR
jgi:hypothetical protein